MPGDTKFELTRAFPPVSEYRRLRSLMGWGEPAESQVEAALRSSLFFSAIADGSRVVAFGRVVGDGSLYFYLQDIMVEYDVQRQGLGARIVRDLVDQVMPLMTADSFVGLLAVPGSESFYAEQGFLEQLPQHTVMEILN